MIGLSEAAGAVAPTSTYMVDVLALDEALDALSSFDAQQCRVVELRFFAGKSRYIPHSAPSTIHRTYIN